MMTSQDCCVGNPEGLAYVFPGTEECRVCFGKLVTLLLQSRGGVTGSKGHKLIFVGMACICSGDDFQWGNHTSAILVRDVSPKSRGLVTKIASSPAENHLLRRYKPF